ncbi:hypothetical protein Bbelb_001920 [Branchiostoma belcheri]|nr:hypothetical protein Bbelb_001920 [Branchiostoma belcheri]
MPGHGLGHTARVPNCALGLSTVWDTRGLSRTVPDRAQFWTHKGLVPFRALGAELSVLREEPSRGRAQFWTRDGLIPNHARARSGTLNACPEPCLGKIYILGHAGDYPEPSPPITMIDSASGHGSGQSGCVPFCARSGTEWDGHSLGHNRGGAQSARANFDVAQHLNCLR